MPTRTPAKYSVHSSHEFVIDYSIEALNRALQDSTSFVIDFASIRYRLRTDRVPHPLASAEPDASVVGYLVHEGNHWTSVRFLNTVPWHYASLQAGPRRLTAAQHGLLHQHTLQIYEKSGS